jgi:NADH-quinone oxidoreductase subunit F
MFNPPSPHEVKILTRRFGVANSHSIAAYFAHDGYQGFKKAVEMGPDAVIEEVKKSALRGRGGAGFPTGMKWGFIPRTSPKPKYIVCNADESEPGTCKDRLLIQFDPHQLIEGMIIAGYTMGSNRGYIYIRGEYRYLYDIMETALAEAYQHNYLGKNIQGTGWDFELHVHTGAGAYECGEESALLNSLEGKRGTPRLKPPFPATHGLWQCPTLLNNVESFCAVTHIIRDGAAEFAKHGPEKNGGTRLMCVSGHVERPGVYELPMSTTLPFLINEVCGGVRGGKKLKAVQPGGSSSPILKADECNVGLDFDSLAKAGTMAGSGGIVVLDEDADLVNYCLRIIRFYQHESCGWCIPCREGTTWMKKVLERLDRGEGGVKDIDLVGEISKNMFGRTFCALGDAAAWPTGSIVKKFRVEFEEKLARAAHSRISSPAELVNIA